MTVTDQTSPTKPSVSSVASVSSEQDSTQKGLIYLPCRIDPLVATTFIWYDGYITVATITTTISLFESTTVIASSTYEDREAIEKLSQISEKHPIDSSGTKVLNGTRFTDPYGVVYHVISQKVASFSQVTS